jgi:CubicO group peptidase (beta-lactamase class C family)
MTGPVRLHRFVLNPIGKRVTLPLLLAAIACPAAVRIPAQTPRAEQAVAKGPLAERIDDYMSRLSAIGFSGNLLVAKDGEVLLSKGYGLADRKRGIPASPETVISIGSITKQFTGAAILKLEMQGKLSVNDPITRFFKDVPADKTAITLHHLLTHTSGLESDFGGDFEAVARDELVKRVLASKLRSEPGQRYYYSNSGYSLLGSIIEIVSGQSYEEYLYENLFKPAGMFKTGYLIPKWKQEDVARGYARTGEDWGTILERPWAADGPYWNLRANGGIHSTPGDMYRWHLALEGETILSKEAKQKYFAPHVPEGVGAQSSYGYGWAVFTTPRGTKLIAHNGGNGIFAADFRRYVDDKVVLYIASNNADMSALAVSQHLPQIIFGGQYALPPKVVSIDPKTLGEYSGAYRLPSGAGLTVSVDRGRLQISGDTQETFSLLATGEATNIERLNALNNRAAAIIEGGSKGDYAAMHQAFRSGVPLERIKAMESRAWENWRGRWGAFKGFKVLGTARDPEGGATTSTRLDFERGSVFVHYVWEEGAIVGVRAGPTMPGSVFVPVSPTEFVSFSLEAPSAVRVSFKLEGDRATGLTVHGPKSSTAASREK